METNKDWEKEEKEKARGVREGEGERERAVSYTHLDVYKRQHVVFTHNLR